MSTTTAAVLNDIAKHTKAELVQKDDEVDAYILALLARHHVLVLGEPGIAKTLTAERLIKRIGGIEYFYRALGPFTAPEHIFGNISIAGIKNDEQRYVTKGKLPEADIAVFDEWSRVGNACMQEMLQAWNERTFEQNGVVVKMPLMMGIFPCNFLIDEKDQHELAAAYDRIMVRRVSEPVLDAEGLRALAKVQLDPNPAPLLTRDDLIAAQAAVDKVDVPDDVVDAYIEVFGALTREGLRPSGRRFREALRLVQAAAFLADRAVATTEDLLPLVDVFWNKPEQRRTVERIVWGVASPGMAEVSALIDSIAEIISDVDGAVSTTGDDLSAACVASRRKVLRVAKEVKRLTGQSAQADRALTDVWRRLQGLHDRIMEALELRSITLDEALEV